jgi:hypothetical protein
MRQDLSVGRLARIFRDLPGVPHDPSVERRMVNLHPTLRHDLLEVAVQHPVSQVEEDSMQDDVLWEVSALERDRHHVLPSCRSTYPTVAQAEASAKFAT